MWHYLRRDIFRDDTKKRKALNWEWWLRAERLAFAVSLVIIVSANYWIATNFSEDRFNILWPIFVAFVAILCLRTFLIEFFSIWNKESIKTTLRGAAKWQEYSYMTILFLAAVKMLCISLPLLMECQWCANRWEMVKNVLQIDYLVSAHGKGLVGEVEAVVLWAAFKRNALAFINICSSPCTSLLLICAWIHCIFFSLLAFDLTGPLLLKIRHVIFEPQTRFFFYFFFFLVVGFGLSIMKEEDGDTWLPVVVSFRDRMLFLAGEAMEIDALDDDKDCDKKKDCKNSSVGNLFANVIIFLFILFCKMVLFNILLAVMQDIYKDRKEDNAVSRMPPTKTNLKTQCPNSNAFYFSLFL